jgi:glutamate-1-semialdehyde 2,1-aminomutase
MQSGSLQESLAGLRIEESSLSRNTRFYEMVGTLNGNPLAMAAARAMLTKVATDEAYRRIEGLRSRASAGISTVIKEWGMNGRVVTAGAKGSVVFADDEVRYYRGFLGLDVGLALARLPLVSSS